MPKIHKDYLEGWDGDLKSLARAICDLKYDRTAEFIEELASAVFEDGEADMDRDRMKLAGHLTETSVLLTRAGNEMQKAWKVCEPYMEPVLVDCTLEDFGVDK